ncbi:zinc-binding dehydrogenase [Apiospora saccharicola]|uniref:Zinc-binding dehydrogenase n=1 Tax=Apiospora saccharicola TaxID=335842 RepID=A0ABR1VLY7_9PEZI
MTRFMRAVDIRSGSGPASALFINDEMPVPEPQPGECLVKIKAFGINRGDMMQRDGMLVFPGVANMKPILGLEFSGVIAEMRPGDDEEGDEWKVGDEVFGLLGGGGYAEYVNVHRKMLIRKPRDMSHEQAGGLCEVNSPGTPTLVATPSHSTDDDAAASSTSFSTASTAPAVFATARKPEKCAFATEQLGATAAVDLSQHPDKRSWAAEVKAHNGHRGVDLVVT